MNASVGNFSGQLHLQMLQALVKAVNALNQTVAATAPPLSLPVTIGQGGSGQTTQAAAFDALSPTTTRGDLIARGATSNQRLALGATGQVVQSNGTDAVFGAVNLAAAAAVTGQLIATSFPALAGDVTSAGGTLTTA
jgi:energy-coupling factor transporter ATP-binding protein EcfA2